MIVRKSKLVSFRVSLNEFSALLAAREKVGFGSVTDVIRATMSPVLLGAPLLSPEYMANLEMRLRLLAQEIEQLRTALYRK